MIEVEKGGVEWTCMIIEVVYKYFFSLGNRMFIGAPKIMRKPTTDLI